MKTCFALWMLWLLLRLGASYWRFRKSERRGVACACCKVAGATHKLTTVKGEAVTLCDECWTEELKYP